MFPSGQTVQIRMTLTEMRWAKHKAHIQNYEERWIDGDAANRLSRLENPHIFANDGGIAPVRNLALLEVPYSNQLGIHTYTHMRTCTHASRSFFLLLFGSCPHVGRDDGSHSARNIDLPGLVYVLRWVRAATISRLQKRPEHD